MHFLPIDSIDDFNFIREDEAKAKGRALHPQYESADPFPHIVIENFLPRPMIDRLCREFPPIVERELKRKQELFKGYILPDQLPSTAAFARALFYTFNSKPFLSFLEEISGIDGLIPDPYFLGGGFHETLRGGNLGIHADFNLHQKLRLRRRMNVLVYLNEDWDPSFGGNLELWAKDMSRKVKEVSPLLNRCVIFSTDDTSWHGHPDPLACPENRSRRSLALYYYTASDSLLVEEKVKTTVFQQRKGTNDVFDWSIQLKYFLRDFIPPILLRQLLRIKKLL